MKIKQLYRTEISKLGIQNQKETFKQILKRVEESKRTNQFLTDDGDENKSKLITEEEFLSRLNRIDYKEVQRLIE